MDIAVAAMLGVTPWTLVGLVLGGVVIVAGLCSVIGLAMLADLNQTIKVIHQRDTPAR